MLGEILRRLRYWLQRGADADLNDEMRLHIEMRAAKLQASGLLPQEAWSEANQRFGSSLHLRERSRDMWLGHWIDELTRDLRIASRGLWRRPGFALAAVLTLALGIGSNTAVFSVVNSVLLNPLPYPDADRLVAVANQAPGAQGLTTAKGDLLLSASMYVTFAEQNQTLDALGVWSMSMATVTGTGEAEQVRAVQISDGVLRALRVQPARGPGFASADYVPGGRAMVLLSDGYWRRRFGADPGIIGRSLIVDSRQLVVAGVMPAGFRLVDTEADLIYTFRFNRNQLELSGFGLQGLARLKPGVDINRANKDLARLIPVWMKSWPTVPGVSPMVFEAWRITPGLRPLKEEVVGDIGSVLWPVMGTLALVMLIVSANVAGLVLVRMQARQPELATRRALGASSGRILREVLMETLLLGLAGGLLGLTLAAVGVRLLAAYGPSTLPRLSEIAVDARAVLFALGYSILGAVLAGLIPALKYARKPLEGGPLSATRLLGPGRESSRAQDTLVIIQVSLAVVLLISAGLMVRTFVALQRVELGIRSIGRIQTARIAVPGSPDQVIRTHSEILEQVRNIPGVESAAFVSEAPLDGGRRAWDAVCIDGQRLVGTRIPPIRTYKSVSPGLFDTMGTPLKAGRDFTWTDAFEKRPYIVISENLAIELFGSAQAAIGHRAGACGARSTHAEVIGVAGDVHDKAVATAPPAIVYWPPFFDGLYGPGDIRLARNVALVVRTKFDQGEGFATQMHQAVSSVNKSIPLGSIRSMQAIVDRSLAPTSFALVLLGIAGAMALLLGVVGIYGVIAYSVARRRREIGVRLALGAGPASVKALFVRKSLLLTASGIVFGLAASAGLMHLMKAMLFGTEPLDPIAYSAVPSILLGAAALASYLPARRAAKIDPAIVLRSAD